MNRYHGYTVYIEEKCGYQPYLVLTDNYNGDGNVLLLRNYTLNERQTFNDPEGYSAYYEGSYMDRYLNSEYLDMLTEEMQEKILESNVVICATTAWGGSRGGPATEIIQRKAFLLSAKEISSSDLTVSMSDGEPLKYFKKVKRIYAYNEKEEPASYFLRTPTFVSTTSILSVSHIGGLGSVYTMSANGVRPAFCLDGELEIKESESIIEGEAVYVLAD